MLINNKYNIIFIHCNKCAGKSIEHLLFDYEKMDWSDHSSIKDIINNGGIKPLLKNTVFTIVRNPYHRIVSYVADAKRAAKKMNISLDKFKESINYYYNRYKDNKESPIADIKTYKYMLQVNNNDDNLKYIDEVLNFENLNEDYKKFCNKYNIKENKLPHINSSNVKKDYDSFYNNEIKEKVYEMYKWDFNKFGYNND